MKEWQKNTYILSVGDLMHELLHPLKQRPSSNEMSFPFLLTHPIWSQRNQNGLCPKKIFNRYPTYFQVKHLLLAWINLALWLLNSCYRLQFVLIYVMSHRRFYSFHVTVVFWYCPLLTMVMSLEKLCNQTHGLVFLLYEW